MVDVLDGFEADGFGLLGEVEEELLRLHVHRLREVGLTKVRLRWCSSLS